MPGHFTSEADGLATVGAAEERVATGGAGSEEGDITAGRRTEHDERILRESIQMLIAMITSKIIRGSFIVVEAVWIMA